jgi:hypothetical protein
MIAWAKALQARGQPNAARHIAMRLREFKNADAEEFFEPCPDSVRPAGSGLPFQCELPARVVPWREFLSPRSGDACRVAVGRA